MSKFSSNHACRAEHGRFPICFKMWKLCLQYWLRLENGTDNIILNQVYQCNKEENHYWYQSIKYLLCINGLGNIWYCPPIGHTYSIKPNGNILRKRLEEQYIQDSDTKCLYHQIFIIPYLFCIILTGVHHTCLMSKMYLSEATLQN